MTHGVLIQNKVLAQNVETFNRPAKSAADLDNGNVVQLSTGYTGTAGEGEVWAATTPATGAGLTGLWMVGEPPVVTTVSGTKSYKGIDPDPQDFYVPAGKVFSAFRISTGDIVTLTDAALAGTKSTNGYVVATNGTVKLTWAAAPVSGVSLKLLDTTYISIPDGTIGTQRVVAYRMECSNVA